MTSILPVIHQRELTGALACIGLSWEGLLRDSAAVVLFGSRAAGVAHERSDWDLLCVGEGRTRRTRQIDLIWLTPEELHSHTWLMSELAGHIAHYGRWLVGTPDWAGHVEIGRDACLDKRIRIARRVAVWERFWPRCSPRLRLRYARLLRRNLQRHALLLAGEPVPPSAILDQAWREVPDARAAFQDLAGSAGVSTAFVREAMLPFTAT